MLDNRDKTGKWIFYETGRLIFTFGIIVCSLCKREPADTEGQGYALSNYCPHCGAKMDFSALQTKDNDRHAYYLDDKYYGFYWEEDEVKGTQIDNQTKEKQNDT